MATRNLGAPSIPGDGAAGDRGAQNKPARRWRLQDACDLSVSTTASCRNARSCVE
jgi:hypothetical protein